MLLGYRRSFSAAGRCLIVCFALAAGAHAQTLENNPNTKGGTQVTKPGPAKDLEPALTAIQKSVEGIARTIESVSANPKGKREQERNEEDLRAQQDMAKWAYKMYVATAITAVLTGIGVILIAFTLKYTKDTLGEAKVTTRAAEDAVTVARDIGHAQVRAYVTVVSGGVDHIQTGRWPIVKVKLKNSGQSPARNFAHRLLIGVDRFPLPKVPTALRNPVRSIDVLGSGEESQIEDTFAVALPQGAFDALSNGTGAIYAFGIVEYNDVFGGPHTLKYCLYTTGGEGHELGRLGPYKEGNESD